MRMSQAEKDKSHARIVASASRLLRERGIDGASVGEVMKDAGLTHGGFYKHFASKDALVETALQTAFATFTETLRTGGPGAVQAWRDVYLSDTHVHNPGNGCPVPALGMDVGRGTTQIKAAFSRGVEDTVNALAATMDGAPEERRTTALQQFSMLVGAVVIARASDPDLAAEVLAAASAAVE